MSDRKLVLLQFVPVVLYAALSMPKLLPLPPDVLTCMGCDNPAWFSEPARFMVALTLYLLVWLSLAKLIVVLNFGNLPHDLPLLFGAVVPALWMFFFTSVAYNLVRASTYRGGLTAYDFTSLIPILGFAAVDFIFAARLRKPSRHQLEPAY